MKTYLEMNIKIVNLLRLRNDPLSLYAAMRIEELEKKNDQAKRMERALDRACHQLFFHCREIYAAKNSTEEWKEYFLEEG